MSVFKGDKAGYSALHKRLTSLFGNRKSCDDCGLSDPTRRYEWANLTGRYADPKDYRRLCVPCHRRMDARSARSRHKHRSPVLTLNGVSKTAAQWAEDHSLKGRTIAWRIAHGWPKPLAIKAPSRTRFHARVITYAGKTQSLTDWVRETGVPIGTISARIARGLSLREVFSRKRASYTKRAA